MEFCALKSVALSRRPAEFCFFGNTYSNIDLEVGTGLGIFIFKRFNTCHRPKRFTSLYTYINIKLQVIDIMHHDIIFIKYLNIFF